MFPRRALLSVFVLASALQLPACALKPGQHLISGDVWEIDLPAYRFTSLEWNHISGSDALQRTWNLCGHDGRGNVVACAKRIHESGKCVVFSVYSEAEAKVQRDMSGDPIYSHELRHCGVGMPAPGGWRHSR